MEARFTPAFLRTTAGREAEGVLRKCVHCGFCLATCPTYQLLGDELDSPRGRIYLIKQVLEGVAPTAKTQLHLDRCLTCRACETTCPSGVSYHKLLETGRAEVDRQVPRPLRARALRWLMGAVFRRRRVFGVLVALGRFVSFLLPAELQRQLKAEPAGEWPAPTVIPAQAGIQPSRRMLLLQGCVQPALRPNINAACARVLDRIGISAIEAPAAGCCGALRAHLPDAAGGLADARALIDAWGPQVEAGVEAIVVTASGCGVQVKDYDRLLRDNPAYAAKAARIAELARDPSEVIAPEIGKLFVGPQPTRGKVAFQSPCTLQHGQRITGAVEKILTAAGYELTPVADAHLCCGSAGTYSITQPELSRELRRRKLEALMVGEPQVIATANIGCQTHLAAGTETPVRHWMQLV